MSFHILSHAYIIYYQTAATFTFLRPLALAAAWRRPPRCALARSRSAGGSQPQIFFGVSSDYERDVNNEERSRAPTAGRKVSLNAAEREQSFKLNGSSSEKRLIFSSTTTAHHGCCCCWCQCVGYVAYAPPKTSRCPRQRASPSSKGKLHCVFTLEQSLL